MKSIAATLPQESLRALAEASAVINSTLDLKTVLDNIASTAAQVMTAEAASVLIHDIPRDKLVFVSATGGRSHIILGQEFDAKLGIAGRVASTGRPEIVDDVSEDEDFYHGIDEISNFRTRSLIAAPMTVHAAVIGVVEVLNPKKGKFNDRDKELIQVFANLAAFGVRNAQTHERLRQQHRNVCEQLLKGDRIIGESKPIREVRTLCDKVTSSNATVLLLGETGTGKELFAKYIHSSSPRAESPFIVVNCAALSETLLESELFGHEKGSFTGAVNQHIGRFEQADGGSIFLDEIGEIPLPTQVKLLRVLQQKTFERVGGQETITSDVRIVAATNRDLRKEIQKGTFREDLFYRLNVFPVTLPPLRQRRDDIPLLVEYFTARAAGGMGRSAPKVAQTALGVLTHYDWPGNVRELQNIMERAVLMCDGQTIEPADLPIEIAGGVESDDPDSDQSSLWGIERAMIVKALRDHDWNQTKAAKSLGISRDNLRYRVKKYNISK